MTALPITILEAHLELAVRFERPTLVTEKGALNPRFYELRIELSRQLSLQGGAPGYVLRVKQGTLGGKHTRSRTEEFTTLQQAIERFGHFATERRQHGCPRRASGGCDGGGQRAPRPRLGPNPERSPSRLASALEHAAQSGVFLRPERVFDLQLPDERNHPTKLRPAFSSHLCRLFDVANQLEPTSRESIRPMALSLLPIVVFDAHGVLPGVPRLRMMIPASTTPI
jgi:hypothetical protein